MSNCSVARHKEGSLLCCSSGWLNCASVREHMLLYLMLTSGIQLHRSSLPRLCGNSRLAVYSSEVILMHLSHFLTSWRFCIGFVVTLLLI